MNLKNLKSIFTKNDGQKIYIKELAENDNSKNQVYLGGNFEVLNILPFSDIKPDSDSDVATFKAKVNFSWVGDDGNIYPAPHSQLILYPQYPEVRFSGFLRGCKKAPSDLMTPRLAKRLLFLSVTKAASILGYVAAPDSDLAKEFAATENLNEIGVFKVIELANNVNSRFKLLTELHRIHSLNWITSKKLDADGNILPCAAPQCGGYTLEAELGIRPNSKAEPDFLGWEIKQFGVNNLERLNSAVITLFTPEPTVGFYTEQGKLKFVEKYGYDDRSGKAGREGRRNFGGIFKIGVINKLTGLKMELTGFDSITGKIYDVNGKIVLLDKADREAATWNFSSLLAHWNKKHEQACYVPSLKGKTERKYMYGDKVILGVGTDFQLFLAEMAKGNIYYDPAVKVEIIKGKQNPKARSQFRTKSRSLVNIYSKTEIIDLNKPF